jgi:nitrous oxidase accessory protein NosD
MALPQMVRVVRLLGVGALFGAALGWTSGVGSAGVAGHHHDRQATLFVSALGKSTNPDTSCSTAAFTTIASAITAAPFEGSVVVCPGTYHEQVAITKPLSLLGQDGAIVDEKGVTPTFVVNPPGVGPLTIFAAIAITSSDVNVRGLTVTNALGEGIFAGGVPATIDDISITHNTVVNNDLGGGFPTPASTYFECQVNGEIPGDCGEGIHFLSVANSQITHNYIAGNSGGVLLTDEDGPTHDNLVAWNVVTNNAFDCGITLPGHNPNALSATGQRQPSVAGVYDNSIEHNTITDNGLLGEGAGVLFANAGPGTAVYGNRVQGNTITGNELSGVTLHAHLLPPGTFEDASDNQIVDNVIGKNNVGSPVGPGDSLDAPASITDPLTTGILVYSGTVPVTITIQDNTIFDDHFGIWTGVNHLVTSTLDDNNFFNVVVPISAM